MKTKSIKQIIEQFERIKEFAINRRKGYIKLLDTMFDYTDNIEDYFGLKYFSFVYETKTEMESVKYWCDEAFKPVPFEIYTKH